MLIGQLKKLIKDDHVGSITIHSNVFIGLGKTPKYYSVYILDFPGFSECRQIGNYLCIPSGPVKHFSTLDRAYLFLLKLGYLKNIEIATYQTK